MFGAKSFQLLHWYSDGSSRSAQPRSPLVASSLASSSLASSAPRAESNTLLSWSTCLRTLQLVEQDAHQGDLDTSFSSCPPSEVLVNEKAYQRILEIICGLHSPLIGETEVLGQFKQTLSDQIEWLERSGDSAALRARSSLLKSWGRALLADAKEIRTRFLLDLGSQSYGSLVRRELRQYRETLAQDRSSISSISMAMIGGGQLAQEIAPWLMKAADGFGGKLPLLIRNAKSPRPWVAAQGGLEVRSLFETWPDVDVFVLAAPMGSLEISEALSKLPHRQRFLIDLRGESRTDPVRIEDLRVSELADIFQSMEASRAHAEAMKEKALSAVAEKAEERFNAVHHRPFGWDDVWS